MARIRKPLIITAFLATTLFIGGFALQNYSLKEGYKVLSEHGAEAAIEYFAKAQRTKSGMNDVSILYGYAWSNFKDKRYGVAEDYCQRILNSDPSKRRQADVFYLLGHIYLATGSHVMSNLRFNDAIGIYKSLENQGPNVHRAELGLCMVFLESENYEEASLALDRAAQYSGKIKSLSDYYYFRTLLAFKTGDYKIALKYSRLALSDANSDEVSQAKAFINISFYSMLLGDFEAGLKYNQMAQRLIVKNGLNSYHYYNRLNMILYNRCTGEDYDELVEEVEQVIMQEHNMDLQSIHEFVLNWECGRIAAKL